MRALGLAHHWQRLLDEERAASVADIASCQRGRPKRRASSSATHTESAEQFVEFLLSPEAQQYFADETYEFPLVDGVEPSGDLPPLEDLSVTRLDLDTLGGELTSSIEMIRESGLQR